MMSSNSTCDRCVNARDEKQNGIYVLFHLKLMNILLVVPVGTASDERSLSQIKIIKTRLLMLSTC